MRLQYLVLVVPMASIVFSGPLLGANREAVHEPFAVAELFLELNDTDGDLGIHAAIDGGEWTSLEIEGPREQRLLGILTRGGLRRQALTQLSLESTEPQFTELDPARFLRRFPEGEYEIEGRTLSDVVYESVARLSHVLAAPVVPVVSGMPAGPSCDADPLPDAASPVVIDWDPVATSHPSIGKAGPVEISRYQFFVEQGPTKLSVDLPPTITEFEIPAVITARAGIYKFEIIARTSAGNNTAIESCFRIR